MSDLWSQTHFFANFLIIIQETKNQKRGFSTDVRIYKP